MKEIQVQPLGWKDPLEEDMATHSSVLDWETPRTEEPGGLQSMGSQKESDTTERLNTHTGYFEIRSQSRVRGLTLQCVFWGHNSSPKRWYLRRP